MKRARRYAPAAAAAIAAVLVAVALFFTPSTAAAIGLALIVGSVAGPWLLLSARADLRQAAEARSAPTR